MRGGCWSGGVRCGCWRAVASGACVIHKGVSAKSPAGGQRVARWGKEHDHARAKDWRMQGGEQRGESESGGCEV